MIEKLSLVQHLPITGPMKIPRFPAKANQLKAVACVLYVEFSESMALTVLYNTSIRAASAMFSGSTYTTVPEKTPARQRNKTICQIDLLKPKRHVATDTPMSELTRTGLRPNLSAARPQDIIKIICVREKRDSYKTNYQHSEHLPQGRRFISHSIHTLALLLHHPTKSRYYSQSTHYKTQHPLP